MYYKVISWHRLKPSDIAKIVHPFLRSIYMRKLNVRRKFEFDEILLVEFLSKRDGVLDPLGAARKDVPFLLRYHITNMIDQHDLMLGMSIVGGEHYRNSEPKNDIIRAAKILPLLASIDHLDALKNSLMDTAHYVGGITKTIGDTVTSSVESVLNNPSVIADTVNNLASTIIDGVTYFPDVVLDEIAPELSYGAKDRTNKRIGNALDGISEKLDQLDEDYVKHNQAVSSGDFEAAGAVIGGYVSSAVLPSKKIKALGDPVTKKKATFGVAISKDYKKTFFDFHPELKGKVVVHHAVEQQIQRRYPGLVSDSDLHSFENLRGIPTEKNGDIHLSKIRKEWNRFYKTNPMPTQDDLLNKATEIDVLFGSEFTPPLKNISD